MVRILILTTVFAACHCVDDTLSLLQAQVKLVEGTVEETALSERILTALEDKAATLAVCSEVLGKAEEKGTPLHQITSFCEKHGFGKAVCDSAFSALGDHPWSRDGIQDVCERISSKAGPELIAEHGGIASIFHQAIVPSGPVNKNAARSYYVLGHHNGCPANYQKIRNEGQCKAAVAALGLKKLGEKGAWPDMPGGCYKHKDGEVFLNTGNGTGAKGATPICEWMWGNYFKIGHGNGCPDHYISVHDPENCEKAVKALHLESWEKHGKFSDKPGGCFHDPSGRVFLNTIAGAGAAGHSPICEWHYDGAGEQSSVPSSTIFAEHGASKEDPDDDEDA